MFINIPVRPPTFDSTHDVIVMIFAKQPNTEEL